MSITDQPVVLYLNQPYIDQQMQLANEGIVSEIVEEYGETDSTTTSGGLKIYNVLNFMREKLSEETENIAKNIQSTPVGRFAVYHGLVDDSGDLIEVSTNASTDMPQIRDADFISISGKISKSPINDMISIFDRLGISVTQLMEEYTDNDTGSDDLISNEQIGSEFEEASDSYYMKMNSGDGAFYFELAPSYFENVGTDFPSEYSEYTVFGEVDHVFKQNEKEYVVDLMNIIPQRKREQKVKIRRIWSDLTYALNKIPGREFSANEFYLSAPDIRMTPIAIYK